MVVLGYLKEVAMGSFKHSRAFDPLDLEIIDRVYEAAWAQVESCDPGRDREKDSKRQEALKQRIFALAWTGHVDFDKLCDKVLANLSGAELAPPAILAPASPVPSRRHSL